MACPNNIYNVNLIRYWPYHSLQNWQMILIRKLKNESFMQENGILLITKIYSKNYKNPIIFTTSFHNLKSLLIIVNCSTGDFSWMFTPEKHFLSIISLPTILHLKTSTFLLMIIKEKKKKILYRCKFLMLITKRNDNQTIILE